MLMLRRSLLTFALVAGSVSLGGCAGLLADTEAALSMANNAQYVNFSESWDKDILCSGTRYGYMRVYHGISSNYRYVYYYNATTLPMQLTITWSNGGVDTETLYPRTYSSRFTRYATYTANANYRWTCPG
jgi:hypothetical protein